MGNTANQPIILSLSRVRTRLALIEEAAEEPDGPAELRNDFETLQERAALTILQAMRDNIFSDRVKLQASLTQVESALHALRSAQTEDDLHRIVGQLHRQLPTVEYCPTSPRYSLFSPSPPTRCMYPLLEVYLGGPNIIHSYEIICLQLGVEPPSDAESSGSSEAAQGTPPRHPPPTRAVCNPRVVGPPLVEGIEPELGSTAPATNLAADPDALSRAYGVTADVPMVERPTSAQSSRFKLAEKVDMDRVGERTVQNSGANTTLAIKYPTLHPYSTAWNRLNANMNRGGIRILWWAAAHTYVASLGWQ